MGTDRNNEGRFTQQHTDADVVAAVRAYEPAATSEVAGELGIARQSADYRLRKLRDSGRVSSKKIGASLVWFSPVDLDTEDNIDRVDAAQRTGEGLDTDQHTDVIEQAIRAVDTPGSGGTAESRERALREIYDYLRMQGEGSKSAFRDHLEANNIDVGYRGGFESFWTNYVKAKDALKQLPNVEVPGEGEHTYSYVGDRDT